MSTAFDAYSMKLRHSKGTFLLKAASHCPKIDQFVILTSRAKQTHAAIEFTYMRSAKRQFYSKLTEILNFLAKEWMHTCNA